MTTEALHERILAILQEVANNDEVARNPDLPLYASGLLDSLATVSLMAAFADEFGVTISPAEFDAEAWATPRKLVADITRRAGAGRA